MSSKSYFELFEECLQNMGHTFDSFTSNLIEKNNYYFVLVHHENKNIVDYSNKLGSKNYKDIVHVMTRDSDTLREYNFDDDSQWKNKINIRTPIVYKNFDILDELNSVKELKLPIENEGILIKMYNPKMESHIF